MPRYRLVKKETLSASARATALPVAFDDVDIDLLVEWLMPQSPLRSRTQLRMQIEDEMAAALERAMRGERSAFMDIYEYVPGDEQPGGVYAVTRWPGPLLREIAATHCFVPAEDDARTPQPLLLRDVTTGAVNELLTPGGMATLRGFDIAWDAAADNEGVFLVDALDGTEFWLEAVSDDANNDTEVGGDVGLDQNDGAKLGGGGEREEAMKDGQIEMRLRIPPGLPAGSFRLEVRNRSTDGPLQVGRLAVEVRVAG